MKIKRRLAPAVAGLLAGSAAVAATSPASAQDAGSKPSCDSYTNPVIISGSSASKPVLQALATAFAADGVPISIIYASPDSCLGVSDWTTGAIGNESSSAYLPPSSGSPVSCSLGSSDTVDIAVSDVYGATCVTNASVTLPTNFAEVQGPIQAMTMAVPGGSSGSSANVISAQAAYVVFGADATSPNVVAPWTSPTNIFTRETTSGVLDVLASAIGLAPSKWANAVTTSSTQYESSTSNMEKAVANVTSNQSATIGILSTASVATWNAVTGDSVIKVLAFQATGQDCGYFPDSSQSALDKINTRQGRYAIFGPVHFLVQTNSSGAIVAEHPGAAATVLNYLLATGPNPNAPLFGGAITSDAGAGASVSTSDISELITAEAKPGYVVPWCAMQVMRTAEVTSADSNIASYASPEPCSCLFEETAAGGPVAGHTCTTCTSSSSCPSTAPVCRYGYCEVN